MIIYKNHKWLNINRLKVKGKSLVYVLKSMLKSDSNFHSLFIANIKTLTITTNKNTHVDFVIFPFWLNVFVWLKMKNFVQGTIYISSHNRHVHFGNGNRSGVEVLQLGKKELYPLSKTNFYSKINKDVLNSYFTKIYIKSPGVLTTGLVNNTILGNLLLFIYGFDIYLKQKPFLKSDFKSIAQQLGTSWEGYQKFLYKQGFKFSYTKETVTILKKAGVELWDRSTGLFVVLGLVFGYIVLDRFSKKTETYPDNYQIHTREG